MQVSDEIELLNMPLASEVRLFHFTSTTKTEFFQQRVLLLAREYGIIKEGYRIKSKHQYRRIMISRTKPTVRTIAAELGVSAMTITRALNGHPKVSTETRRRVLAKVKEVGYDFRASSRTVRQERDRNVAIHCGDDKLYSDNILNFYMRLHYLCQRRLKAEGLRGQLIDLNVHAEAAFPVLDNCGSLILLGPVEQARLETVRKRYPELRIISVFGSVDGVTQVGPDDYEGGAFAARRFAALGHRHAAVFATLSESGFCKRYGGFVAEFQARQPGARVDLIQFSEEHDQSADDRTRRQRLDEYFTSVSPLPTACFVPNGYAGVFLADYLAERGWRIPEDFSLIVYDNLELFDFRTPALARVWFDLKELAAQAVTALQNQLRDRDSRPVSISIANEFTPGGSLAAPRNPRREL